MATKKLSSTQIEALELINAAQNGQGNAAFMPSTMFYGWVVVCAFKPSIATLRALQRRGLIELPSYLRCRVTDAGRDALNAQRSATDA